MRLAFKPKSVRSCSVGDAVRYKGGEERFVHEGADRLRALCHKLVVRVEIWISPIWWANIVRRKQGSEEDICHCAVLGRRYGERTDAIGPGGLKGYNLVTSPELQSVNKRVARKVGFRLKVGFLGSTRPFHGHVRCRVSPATAHKARGNAEVDDLFACTVASAELRLHDQRTDGAIFAVWEC
ncbi:hypothetical protein BDW74DRAFT_19026 [Aspergillus multicolor]|uniref:uncharacterized protein n=1 Tax=Aspergillus multicolor TaxID=41759 RepID=UPI003CCCAA82